MTAPEQDNLLVLARLTRLSRHQSVVTADGHDPGTAVVEWQLHLAPPPTAVFGPLASDAGRALFWAESAVRCGDHIDWGFPDGQAQPGPGRRPAVRLLGPLLRRHPGDVHSITPTAAAVLICTWPSGRR